MTMPEGLGRLLVVLGAVLVALGLLLQLTGRLPWLGRLPGDIVIRREHFTIHFPLTTSLLISLALSFLLWLFRR
jgi:hypothetical protein